MYQRVWIPTPFDTFLSLCLREFLPGNTLSKKNAVTVTFHLFCVMKQGDYKNLDNP